MSSEDGTQYITFNIANPYALRPFPLSQIPTIITALANHFEWFPGRGSAYTAYTFARLVLSDEAILYSFELVHSRSPAFQDWFHGLLDAALNTDNNGRPTYPPTRSHIRRRGANRRLKDGSNRRRDGGAGGSAGGSGGAGMAGTA